MSVADRLKELGIELPKPVAPVATYVPYVITGNLISVSGQIPIRPDGTMPTGKVGEDLTLEEGQAVARQCGINILAQLNSALDGNLDRVKRIVRLGIFVNSVDGYGDQPKVGNGASDLMVDVFGDAGRHSRAAVGVNGLPLNVPVEIDALVEITD